MFIQPPSVTNPPVGATITVGGPAPTITLAQALAYANGTDVPSQAQAMLGISTYYNNTNDLTNAWKLGPAFADTISIIGTVSDNATFNLNFDTIGGTFSGNVVLSGQHNTFGGTFQNSGSVVISGNYNAIGGTFQGPLTVSGISNNLNFLTYNGPAAITGSNNTINGGTLHAPMTMAGDNNSFIYPLFKNVTGNALTISGNRNTGYINCQTNAGDGLVINGGKFNQITVNQSIGNSGNGVTLTGGAEGNQLIVGTRRLRGPILRSGGHWQPGAWRGVDRQRDGQPNPRPQQRPERQRSGWRFIWTAQESRLTAFSPAPLTMAAMA